MSLITAPCAVCGGADFTLVYPATITHAEVDPALYYSSSRVYASHLNIVRCVNCGLLLTNPRDDDATLARVYVALQDVAYDVEDDTRQRTARSFLDLVERHHPQPAQLLDVGCATGMFVAVAQQAGWQVTGLEASSWAIDRAKARCPQATFITGLLEKVDFPGAGFDVITLWDVLEHVRSPGETLQRVRRWLKSDGWLFLNVPNAGSRAAKLMGRRWVLLLREHLWYFDPQTMAQLLRPNGFQLIHTQPNWVHFSLSNVLMRIAQYRGVAGRLAESLAQARVMKRVNVRFPMGEMTVVARQLPGEIVPR